jgi:carboxyl-terminal processing protease
MDRVSFSVHEQRPEGVIMRPASKSSLFRSRFLAIAGLLLFGGLPISQTARADGVSSEEQEWRQGLKLIGQGSFDRATDVFDEMEAEDSLTRQVQTWLKEYQEQQQQRRELNRKDFEKYVRYAHERIERKEYDKALSRVILAADVAEDRQLFLKEQWILQLVDDALARAQEFRNESDWRGAWEIYWRLAELFEREPLYKKLERQMLTHLRLDLMFEEDSQWEDGLENVKWRDAQRALDYIDRLYFEPVDFKEIAENALEELLILAESKTAQKTFTRLGDENDRREFQNRIQARLDLVRAAPRLDKDGAVQHFRRVVLDINPQTVQLPQELVVSELMRGALHPLDDFTSIIWPTEAEDFDKHTRGDFIGVGISIIKNRKDEVEVSSPMEDTPAYRAGILPGDIISKVDGKSLKNLSLTKVVQVITGPKGTPVTLSIRRNGEEMDVTLVRDLVKIPSVKGVQRLEEDEQHWNYWLDDANRIGYIRVVSFARNTVEHLHNTIANLLESGMKGLVLDLRGNPGGLLDSAFEMSALFLEKGMTVVSTDGPDRLDEHVFKTPWDGPFTEVPLVVLVDENSASASEIVSGAIRDNGRGVVVGSRTFGKGSVQNLIQLSRSNAKLKLTTADYFLPGGSSIHKKPGATKWGVEPDIPVRLVRKEILNVYLMRRDADRIGPPPTTDGLDEASLLDIDRTEEPSQAETEDQGGAGDEQEPAEASKNDEEEGLPPLEQPDENDRPKIDPQLDTALLVMRAKLLLNRDFAKIAAAQIDERKTQEPMHPEQVSP